MRLNYVFILKNNSHQNMTPAILKIKIWLLACFSIFLPIKPLIITVGFLCISDMVVGIWKALKKKEPISSKRMSDTITKLMLYQLAIVSGFLIEKYVIEELVPITKTIGTVISIIEFKSIIESIESVTRSEEHTSELQSH